MSDESLFTDALAIADPAARAAHLDGACRSDAELRRRIDALLAAHFSDDSFLDRPVGAENALTAESPAGTSTYDASGTRSHQHSEPVGEAGQVIAGKYKLIEAIGEGGMGTVWMAQQTEPVKRGVAVKLIKEGMDSKAVQARFEAERQALAMMDHPNIAKILDGGLHEGRPYFVMELVKGIPITQFCDARKLTPNARLELFVQVCNAIQHAHQKGVIHRDIKPSNVLVALFDDRPVPKVIDFGVAKATGAQLTDRTLMTGFGAVVGTPEYMSPEQASFNQMDVDTRSDIYALGVLLYELLTGTTPVDRKSLGKAALLEILRIVREVEAPRPSAKLSTSNALPSISANRGIEPKKLTGLMRNELDWIVMKALEKDRARRYDTANGFAADVQRYLAGEAVQAHPPTAGYRLRKAYRKNRGPVLASSVVLLVLLGGIAGTTWGLIRADVRRMESEQARSDEADQRLRAEIAAADALAAELAMRRVFDATVDDLVDKKLLDPNARIDAQFLTTEERAYLGRMRDYFRDYAGGLADGPARAAARLRWAKVCIRLGDEEGVIAAFEAMIEAARLPIPGAPDGDRGPREIEVLLRYRRALEYTARTKQEAWFAAGSWPAKALFGGLGGPWFGGRHFEKVDAVTDRLIALEKTLAGENPGSEHRLRAAEHTIDRARQAVGRFRRDPPSLTSDRPEANAALVGYRNDFTRGIAAYRSILSGSPDDPRARVSADDHLGLRVQSELLGLLFLLPESDFAELVQELIAYRIETAPPPNNTAPNPDSAFSTVSMIVEHVRYESGWQIGSQRRRLFLERIDSAIRAHPQYRYGTALAVAARLHDLDEVKPNSTRPFVEFEAIYREILALASAGNPPSPYADGLSLSDHVRRRWISRILSVKSWLDKGNVAAELEAWQRKAQSDPKPNPAALRVICAFRIEIERRTLPSGQEAIVAKIDRALETLRIFGILLPTFEGIDRARIVESLSAWLVAVLDCARNEPKEMLRFLTAAIEFARATPPREFYLFHTDALLRRAELHMAGKRFSASEDDCRAALKLETPIPSTPAARKSAWRMRLLGGLACLRQNRFDDAEKLFEEGYAPQAADLAPGATITVWEAFARDLATCAQELYSAGRLESSANWFERASSLVGVCYKSGSVNAGVLARTVCRPRALTLYRLNRNEAAIAAIDDLLNLLAHADAEPAKIFRARCVARLGDHAAASKAAREILAGAGPLSPYNSVFDAASCFAFCTSFAKEAADKEAYATEAVALLRRCAKGDPKLLAQQLSLGDFNSLRGREDFKTLKADVETQFPTK